MHGKRCHVRECKNTYDPKRSLQDRYVLVVTGMSSEQYELNGRFVLCSRNSIIYLRSRSRIARAYASYRCAPRQRKNDGLDPFELVKIFLEGSQWLGRLLSRNDRVRLSSGYNLLESRAIRANGPISRSPATVIRSLLNPRICARIHKVNEIVPICIVI